MWDKYKKDKLKLIYAYIISPIWIFLSIGGNISSEIYRMYGSSAVSESFGYSNRAAFVLGMIGYLPLMTPPTFIRFALLQRKLKYGVELSIFLSLSLFISLLFSYFLTSNMPLTFGLFDTFMVYCILSYKSSEYSEEWNLYTFNPIVFTLVALALMTLMSGIMTEQKQWYMPIWETIFACCVLTRHKDKIAPTEPSRPPEPPHREPRQEPEQPPRAEAPDIADTLTDIGLAHIGRVTARDNPYLTPEKTAERRNVERPFIKALYERYPDEQTRKALSRYFMLYKEFTLFVIFSMVLNKDKPLHARVQSKLKVRLSQGLPSKVIAKRNEYWRKLSEKFFESYKRTKDIARTLDYAFWSVLPERIKGEDFANLVGNGYLMQIFEYTKDVIAKEYKKRVLI